MRALQVVSVPLYLTTLLVLQVILAIRTWAVWGRNKIIGAGLAVLTFAYFCTQCTLVIRFLHKSKRMSEFLFTLSDTNTDVDAPPPYHGFRGCLLTNAPKTLWISYTAVTVVEASKPYMFFNTILAK